MDKKEILQRAQRENQDDGMAAAENRGRKYGFSAFCILCIAVLIFNDIYDRPNDLPMAVMMAYLAAESYPRFAFTRKKSFRFSYSEHSYFVLGNNRTTISSRRPPI